jgi:hypothetical protein
MGTVRAVPHLCELYPGICLTTEEKTWKNLSQGSQRVRIAYKLLINTICNALTLALHSTNKQKNNERNH